MRMESFLWYFILHVIHKYVYKKKNKDSDASRINNFTNSLIGDRRPIVDSRQSIFRAGSLNSDSL